jgi:hypothetical protein
VTYRNAARGKRSVCGPCVRELGGEVAASTASTSGGLYQCPQCRGPSGGPGWCDSCLRAGLEDAADAAAAQAARASIAAGEPVVPWAQVRAEADSFSKHWEDSPDEIAGQYVLEDGSVDLVRLYGDQRPLAVRLLESAAAEYNRRMREINGQAG